MTVPVMAVRRRLMTAAGCDTKMLLIRRGLEARDLFLLIRRLVRRRIDSAWKRREGGGKRPRSKLSACPRRDSSPIIVSSYTLLGGRSTVGQQTLTLLIGVRIPASQPLNSF